MAVPQPQQPFCPVCGGPAVWHANLSQWGCDRCRQMLPNQPAAAPQLQRPQQQGYVPPPPQCPQCGANAVWHPAMNHWGCDQCRQMLPQAQPFVAQQETSAGAVLIKVLIVIVLIVLLVVIKVWARGGF